MVHHGGSHRYIHLTRGEYSMKLFKYEYEYLAWMRIWTHTSHWVFEYNTLGSIHLCTDEYSRLINQEFYVGFKYLLKLLNIHFNIQEEALRRNLCCAPKHHHELMRTSFWRKLGKYSGKYLWIMNTSGKYFNIY